LDLGGEFDLVCVFEFQNLAFDGDGLALERGQVLELIGWLSRR
jgi:hypothetical protein